MREIKFRVWDKEENKFFSPIYEAYKGKLLDLSISLSGEIVRRTLEFPAEHESLFPNRYLIQQYTGLKDKNGVEIYEGDIFKTNNHCGKTYFEVVFETSYCGAFGCFLARHLLSFDLENGSESSVHCAVLDECEVIGNIFENPELLKK